MAKKKKKDELTLIQCSVGAKEKIKKQAKKEGVFLNRLLDKIINDYVNDLDKQMEEILANLKRQ